MTLRVGVIGLGLMGSVQVAGFRQNPAFEVTAVCDVNPARAQEVGREYGIPRVYTAPEDLLEGERLDVLAIATPPDLHHALSIAGLQRGWHVLCEKPMALNTGQATEMWHHAQTSGQTNIIDHELRFNGNRARIQALISAGYVGRPRHALVVQVGNSLADTERTRWTWWSEVSRGGGLLGETGSHAIDLLRWWLGEVVKVRGAVRTFVTERPDADGRIRPVETDDYTAFSLEFRDGVVAEVVISGVGGYPGWRQLEIHGEDGALVLDRDERLWGHRRGRQDAEDLTVEETVPSLVNYPGDIWSPAFVRLVGRFADAIRDGEKPSPAADFQDGLHCQRVMDAVRADAGG